MLLSFLEPLVSRVGIRKIWTGTHLFPDTNLSFLNPPTHIAEARICLQVHGCIMETVTQLNAGSNVCHLLSHCSMGPFTYSNQFRLAALVRSCVYLGALILSIFLLWTEWGTTRVKGCLHLEAQGHPAAASVLLVSDQLVNQAEKEREGRRKYLVTSSVGDPVSFLVAQVLINSWFHWATRLMSEHC